MNANSEVATPTDADLFRREEVGLATRNHGMPLEALRYEVTPAGLHYLLIHFDVPAVDADAWRLEIGGEVARVGSFSLADLRSMEPTSLSVTLECAGNGRSFLDPRPVSQPWSQEAVGTATWTGVPLASLLREAEPGPGAQSVVFTGLDRGIDGGIEQDFARGLTMEQASAPGLLLAYEMNGAPLLPQHGFPLRLVVPGWYGMASVKWLRSIEVITRPFEGYQNVHAYCIRQEEDEPGTPLSRILPRALMAPPGVPDFLSRERFLDAGRAVVEGRAWSGYGPVERVEFSSDGGATWADADLGPAPAGGFAWRGWSFAWEAAPGAYELCCRATDAAGRVQPLDAEWNLGGYANNSVQRVPVTVRASTRDAGS
jgi:DMSO/TMAO reductase YedYZ molybdopterin-dependent catalytic subunit